MNMHARSPDRKIHDFFQALRIFRIKSESSADRVAEIVGIDKDTYLRWERGDLTPPALYLKRLYEIFPELRYFTEYLPRLLRTQLESRALAVGLQGKTLWVPPSATPSDLPVPENLVRTSFGKLLTTAMLDEHVSAEDLQILIGAPDVEVIRNWQRDIDRPNDEQYEQLLGLLPELQDELQPGEQDQTLPPTVTVKIERETIERETVEIRHSHYDEDEIPPPPSPPTIKRGPGRPPVYRHPLPPPKRPVVEIRELAPPPPAPIVSAPPQKMVRKPSSVELAGIEYGQALLALEHARTYLEDLEAEKRKIEQEIEELKEAAEYAEKRLKGTIRHAAVKKD